MKLSPEERGVVGNKRIKNKQRRCNSSYNYNSLLNILAQKQVTHFPVRASGRGSEIQATLMKVCKVMKTVPARGLLFIKPNKLVGLTDMHISGQ